ncbi:MAG TPA: phage holin family protein [Solirubrobacteraceae bacterium]|nr:phage holin family protein [Solirubrobacteraceae bacterium]
MSDAPNPPLGQDGRQQGIAAAITEVTERASLLIREEIELAKTEIAEKTTRLAKGAVVAIVAGVFFFTALFFVLIGCAWLLYYELPIGNEFTYFWGFFAMALILVVLGVIAGLLAYRAVKAGAPPTPDMAIEEARKIRETVSSSSGPSTPSTSAFAPATAAPASSASSAAVPDPASPTPPPPTASASAGSGSSAAPADPAAQKSGTTDSGLGRGTVDGTTLDS